MTWHDYLRGAAIAANGAFATWVLVATVPFDFRFGSIVITPPILAPPAVGAVGT